MAADLRGTALGGNGQAAEVSSITVTVPATIAAGDYAVLSVEATTAAVTLTTPTGWSLLSGPDVSSFTTAWLLGKTLTSGDAGATVTLTLSTARRVVAQMSVYSGVTATGLFTAKTVDTSSSGSPSTPSVSSVPTGALVHMAWTRRYNGTPAPDITPPSGFSQGSVNRSATAYGSSPELSVEAGYLVAPSAGTYGGTAASATSSSLGVTYAVVLQASGGTGPPPPVVIVGATAHVSLDSSPGVPVFVGASKVITGVPARIEVSATGGNITGTAIPVVQAPSVWPPDPYRQAIRSGVAIWYSVKATRLGVVIEEDLRPTGGSITDTIRPGVRRALTVEFADPDTTLYDALIPQGTTLTVTAHIRYTDRQTFDLPMGVFDVDGQNSSESAGTTTIVAPDKWIRVMRGRFVRPKSSNKGMKVVDQIAELIRGALGASEEVRILSTSQAKMAALTWERDRDQAIIKAMQDAGLRVYFDRDGVCTIDNAPTFGASADWLIDAGAAGVLTDLDRSRSREGAANLIVVESSAADEEKFPTVYVWDNDPDSPTYLIGGTGASTSPPNTSLAGPFTAVPFFYSSPNLDTVDEAIAAGKTILARTTGLASSVSLSQVPNPAADSGDVIDVLPPGQRAIGLTTTSSGSGGSGFGTGPFGTMPFGGGVAGGSLYQRVIYQPTRSIERHIADTVTHSLSVDGEQRIEGRSTRTDEFTEGG